MIYLLEDDDSIRDFVIYSLNSQGMEARGFGLPSQFWQAVEQEAPSLVLLDIMLPEEDGLTVLKKLRAAPRTATVPVIMLTAKSTEYDKVLGLDGGADDYVAKPFGMMELLSRIRALLRRAGISAAQPANQMQCGDLTIDLLSGRAAMCGHPLELTQAEFRLLCLLVRNAGRVVTREVILNDLWDNAGDFVDDNTLSVYVRRLREKVEKDPSQPKYLLTVRGYGYQWKGDGT